MAMAARRLVSSSPPPVFSLPPAQISSLSEFWTHVSKAFFSADGRKSKLSPLQERRMVDRCKLHVRGGEGGAGITSFRKSRHSRHGFADGGNGGIGGSVILVSSAAVWDFSNLHHHLNAKSGGPGHSKRQVGFRGADKIVQVPIGTVVYVMDGSIPSLASPPVTPDKLPWIDSKDCFELMLSSKQILYDLKPEEAEDHVFSKAVGEDAVSDSGTGNSPDVESMIGVQVHLPDKEGPGDALGDVVNDLLPERDKSDEMEVEKSVATQLQSAFEFVKSGQSIIVASGGQGGRGNASMARGCGSQKTLPSFEHEQGQPGSEATLILELKTLADVGLVGMPNAGKSTLLGAISRAKPATGHYAFTTLRPNIGKLEFEDFFSIAVADIPGLIEGAHQNRGLGHDFLRHIERTKALAYVVDLAIGLGETKGLLPWEQLKELMFELEQYQPGLSSRPFLVVANKIDETGAEAALEELRRRVPTIPVYPISAILGEGIDALKTGLRDLVEASK